MSLTTDEPTHEPDPNPLDLDALESQLKARQTRRDGWTLMIFAFAAVAKIINVQPSRRVWRAFSWDSRASRSSGFGSGSCVGSSVVRLMRRSCAAGARTSRDRGQP